jgi:hypothetical protein
MLCMITRHSNRSGRSNEIHSSKGQQPQREVQRFAHIPERKDTYIVSALVTPRACASVSFAQKQSRKLLITSSSQFAVIHTAHVITHFGASNEKVPRQRPESRPPPIRQWRPAQLDGLLAAACYFDSAVSRRLHHCA